MVDVEAAELPYKSTFNKNTRRNHISRAAGPVDGAHTCGCQSAKLLGTWSGRTIGADHARGVDRIVFSIVDLSEFSNSSELSDFSVVQGHTEKPTRTISGRCTRLIDWGVLEGGL